MSNDYTLPPVPAHPFASWSEMEEFAIGRYGHVVAAPLVARIAELERSVIECANTGVRMMDAADQEIVRLRAEVEALRDCLAECLDDLSSEINARALGELPRRIERDLAPVRRAAALLAQSNKEPISE